MQIRVIGVCQHDPYCIIHMYRIGSGFKKDCCPSSTIGGTIPFVIKPHQMHCFRRSSEAHCHIMYGTLEMHRSLLVVEVSHDRSSEHHQSTCFYIPSSGHRSRSRTSAYLVHNYLVQH